MRTLIAIGFVSMVLSVAGIASAQSFIDLSGMTSPNYYMATPMGVNNSGEVVLQSNLPPNVQYYHTYVYTGGTAGTYGEITSMFSTSTRAISMNQAGQMAISANGSPYGGLTYTGGLSGTATQIPPTTPNGYGVTYATAIDNAGEVGGGAPMSSNNFFSPYVYTGGGGAICPSPRHELRWIGGRNEPKRRLCRRLLEVHPIRD